MSGAGGTGSVEEAAAATAAEDPRQRFRDRMTQLESLVADADDAAADPATKLRTQTMLSALLELHGQGIARMLALAAERGAAGSELAAAWAADEITASLLLLHGLHPIDLEARVRGALDRVRPRLPGIDLALLGITDGVVRVRLTPALGAPQRSAGVDPALLVDGALCEAAPDAVVEIESLIETQGPGLIPVDRLRQGVHG
jgi:hypothetical protein